MKPKLNQEQRRLLTWPTPPWRRRPWRRSCAPCFISSTISVASPALVDQPVWRESRLPTRRRATARFARPRPPPPMICRRRRYPRAAVHGVRTGARAGLRCRLPRCYNLGERQKSSCRARARVLYCFVFPVGRSRRPGQAAGKLHRTCFFHGFLLRSGAGAVCTIDENGYSDCGIQNVPRCPRIIPNLSRCLNTNN